MCRVVLAGLVVAVAVSTNAEKECVRNSALPTKYEDSCSNHTTRVGCCDASTSDGLYYACLWIGSDPCVASGIDTCSRNSALPDTYADTCLDIVDKATCCNMTTADELYYACVWGGMSPCDDSGDNNVVSSALDEVGCVRNTGLPASYLDECSTVFDKDVCCEVLTADGIHFACDWSGDAPCDIEQNSTACFRNAGLPTSYIDNCAQVSDRAACCAAVTEDNLHFACVWDGDPCDEGSNSTRKAMYGGECVRNAALPAAHPDNCAEIFDKRTCCDSVSSNSMHYMCNWDGDEPCDELDVLRTAFLNSDL